METEFPQTAPFYSMMLILHFSRKTSSAIKRAKVGGQGTILSVGWTYSTLLFTPSQYGDWCCNCSNCWYPHTLLCWRQTGDLSMRDVKYVNKTGWHFFCLQCYYEISNLGKNIFCRYTSSPIQLYFATIKFYCHFPEKCLWTIPSTSLSWRKPHKAIFTQSIQSSQQLPCDGVLQLSSGADGGNGIGGFKVRFQFPPEARNTFCWHISFVFREI